MARPKPADGTPAPARSTSDALPSALAGGMGGPTAGTPPDLLFDCSTVRLTKRLKRRAIIESVPMTFNPGIRAH